MAVTYKQAKKYVGKSVIAECHDGKRHYGTVNKVTKEGVMMAPMQGAYIVGETGDTHAVLADQPDGVHAENVFLPFFLLPFVTLFSLAPYAAYGPGPYGYGAPYGVPYGAARRRRRRHDRRHGYPPGPRYY